MSEYPSPEHVVKREIVFTERASEEVVNGKAYWPIILRLKVNRKQALYILCDITSRICNEYPDPQQDFEFYFFGDITEEREG